jgi:hypothetical protein
MKARILTALLLTLTLTAYNQTSRRAQQDKDKETKQRTYENKNKEQKRETVKQDKRNDNKPASENKRTVNVPENKGRTDKPAVIDNQHRDDKSGRINNVPENKGRTDKPTVNDNPRKDNSRDDKSGRTYNKPENRERTDRVIQHQDRNRQPQSKEGIRRDPNNRVIVHDNKYEPRQRVVVRDNRRETRTYIHIDRPTRNVVTVHHPNNYRPVPLQYRRVHYPYRAPLHSNIFWSVSIHNDFRIFYPEVRTWRYEIGYRIPAVPAYDAEFHIGDVAKVYGKVFDIYYEYESDEYYLYFGDYFPYQDFSVVIQGEEARAFSRRPERFFQGANIAVTGYVSDFEEKPEMVIRRASQIEIY